MPSDEWQKLPLDDLIEILFRAPSIRRTAGSERVVIERIAIEGVFVCVVRGLRRRSTAAHRPKRSQFWFETSERLKRKPGGVKRGVLPHRTSIGSEYDVRLLPQ
jgi:hypothetical protein